MSQASEFMRAILEPGPTCDEFFAKNPCRIHRVGFGAIIRQDGEGKRTWVAAPNDDLAILDPGDELLLHAAFECIDREGKFDAAQILRHAGDLEYWSRTLQ